MTPTVRLSPAPFSLPSLLHLLLRPVNTTLSLLPDVPLYLGMLPVKPLSIDVQAEDKYGRKTARVGNENTSQPLKSQFFERPLHSRPSLWALFVGGLCFVSQPFLIRALPHRNPASSKHYCVHSLTAHNRRPHVYRYNNTMQNTTLRIPVTLLSLSSMSNLPSSLWAQWLASTHSLSLFVPYFPLAPRKQQRWPCALLITAYSLGDANDCADSCNIRRRYGPFPPKSCVTSGFLSLSVSVFIRFPFFFSGAFFVPLWWLSLEYPAWFTIYPWFYFLPFRLYPPRPLFVLNSFPAPFFLNLNIRFVFKMFFLI